MIILSNDVMIIFSVCIYTKVLFYKNLNTDIIKFKIKVLKYKNKKVKHDLFHT